MSAALEEKARKDKQFGPLLDHAQYPASKTLVERSDRQVGRSSKEVFVIFYVRSE
jgi:hypothetical protein